MTVTQEFERRGILRHPVARDRSLADVAALNRRYEEYCRRQVSLLLEIVPREAVRPLYRHARTWATERGLHETKDPMSTLRVFCRDLLPLPPFDVWLLDFENNPLAHLSAAEGWTPLAGQPEPVAVEFRQMEYESQLWRGTLEVYPGGATWRGLIRFQRDGDEDHFRTGEIFCEDDLQDVRDRFISFTAPTMSAFLRSALP